MPSSGYTSISFTAGEQPTTAKWNLIGSNDASFNNGNGFNDGIIVNRHLGSAVVAYSNIDTTTLPFQFTGMYPDFYISATTSMTAGNSAVDTVTLPRAIATGEKVIIIPTSETWCTIAVNQPTSGSTVSATRQCVVTSSFVAYRLSIIYYIPH